MSTDNLQELLKNPEQIKQMINVLSTLLETVSKDNPSADTDAAADTTDNKPKKTKRNRITKKQFGTKEVTQKENKFLSMPEANMYKEDPEVAQKLYKLPPVSRGRKSQIVNARCRICGKEEKIQASLIYGGIDRFKCNKCSSTPG